MAIKKLNFTSNQIIEKGEISFSNSNIVSIIGMNGSGKTVLMKHIKSNFSNDWVKQIVLHSDMKRVKRKLNRIFNTGVREQKFENLKNEIKNNENITEKEVLDKLDDFIWDWFKDSYTSTINQNFTNEEVSEIWNTFENIKAQTKNYFDSREISDKIPEISQFVRYESFQEASNKLQTIWKSIFGNPKIINIDVNESINLNDQIYRNGIGEYSLAEASRRDQNLFFRIMLVALGSSDDFRNLSKVKRYKEIVNNKTLSGAEIDRINDWFKGYVSQEIKISLSIEYGEYRIRFYENEKELNFNDLSHGTQNLLKIISQINSLNSKTIIQIDEPEVGMHPIMQIQFRQFLEDITRSSKTRFLIYTHSPHIAKDGIDTKGLYIMSRSGNISKLYSKDEYIKTEDILDFQIYENIGFESLQKNYNFNKDLKVIIVEGDTDVIYLKKMAKILEIDVNISKAKIGGATNIERTWVLFNAVHGFEEKDIILSPDLDIKEKHKIVYNKIKDLNYFPLGTEKRPEIEGFFSKKDAKYVVSKSSNKNAKMNRANLFWREVKIKSDLDEETIKNFYNYFKKIGLLT